MVVRQVTSVAHRTVSRSPPAPFTTSSMQQLASSLLGFSPSQTMQLAQQLYEGTGSDGARPHCLQNLLCLLQCSQRSHNMQHPFPHLMMRNPPGRSLL